MKTAEVILIDGRQAVKLPAEIRIAETRVSVREEGRAIVLEPLKPATWPDGFFEAIHVADDTFERPLQGNMPPVPYVDAP
jgi:virulence-associated protein VagC